MRILCFAVVVGCGSSPRPEKMAPPALGQSTAPGPSDPSVPPPDVADRAPEKRTSMLDEVVRMDTDAGVPIDALLPPPEAAPPPSTGSGAKLRGSATPELDP